MPTAVGVHAAEYGKTVLVPTLAPLTKNWTLEITPTVVVALAEIVTAVLTREVLPAPGQIITTELAGARFIASEVRAHLPERKDDHD